MPMNWQAKKAIEEAFNAQSVNRCRVSCALKFSLADLLRDLEMHVNTRNRRQVRKSLEYWKTHGLEFLKWYSPQGQRNRCTRVLCEPIRFVKGRGGSSSDYRANGWSSNGGTRLSCRCRFLNIRRSVKLLLVLSAFAGRSTARAIRMDRIMLLMGMPQEKSSKHCQRTLEKALSRVNEWLSWFTGKEMDSIHCKLPAAYEIQPIGDGSVIRFLERERNEDGDEDGEEDEVDNEMFDQGIADPDFSECATGATRQRTAGKRRPARKRGRISPPALRLIKRAER